MDGLTGIYNRKAIEEMIEQALKTAGEDIRPALLVPCGARGKYVPHALPDSRRRIISGKTDGKGKAFRMNPLASEPIRFTGKGFLHYAN